MSKGMVQEREILKIQNLRVDFDTYLGQVKVLNGISLTLYEGEIFGLVGESGCGKSVTALTIVGLLPENAHIRSGEIILSGRNILGYSKDQMRKIRAGRIAMIFQDPMTFLNPVIDVKEQVVEAIKAKKSEQGSAFGKEETMQIALEVLRKVRLPDPDRVMKSYPHELSGGMRQRVMIAMAIARDPDLLIGDEITTALDVTIQAQILELLRALRREFRSAVMVITHDLGVVAEVCDRVGVMYAGDIVEVAAVKELFEKPLHPYTQGLLKAIPRVTEASLTLDSIAGSVPDLINPPSACRFHPRCPYAWDLCKQVKPEPLEPSSGHIVACHLYDSVRKREEKLTLA